MTKCEVCGKPATCFVQDREEILYPEITIIREFRPHGKPHAFCEEHERESQTIQIDNSYLWRN